MRKSFSILAACAVAATLLSGCANAEKKFGRGMSNMMEPVRMGEIRRNIEQAALFDDGGYTTGFIRGLNKTLARTGVGVYEVVTAPFPPYDPPFPNYLAPGPVFPDSYKPTLVEDSTFATDTNLGYSGGDVNPLIPGSRFRIFDTH
jgi:putative exosortase-associated protein (TIGR04073 family)